MAVYILIGILIGLAFIFTDKKNIIDRFTDAWSIKTGDSIMPGFLQPTNRIITKGKEEIVAVAPKNDLQSRIEKETLKRLGKPKDFLKIEIKQVGDKSYRVNILCSKNSPTSLFPTFSRPHSYHVRLSDDSLVFSPSVIKTY